VLTSAKLRAADGIFTWRFPMRENDVWLVELRPMR
jgi:hypothetical protein